MEYDEKKVAEFTLALLYLNTHDRKEGFGARAWKGAAWEALDTLFEDGLICDPKNKAKSVAMTEDGFLKSKELFFKHFGKVEDAGS